MRQNKVTIRICGLNYTIVGEESEAYIRKIAETSEKAINEAYHAAHGSTLEAAVLTVMNLTDEMAKHKNEEAGMREELTKRADRMDELRREAEQASYDRDVLREQIKAHQQEMEEKDAVIARLQKEANDAKAELGRLRAQQRSQKGGN